MYSQCPDCLTVFSLDAQTLAQARGHVVCGHCHIEFDALTSLTGQLPPEPFQSLPSRTPSKQAPLVELAVYRPHLEPLAVVEETKPTAPSFSPRFARPARVRTGRRWPWITACITLLLALSLQIGWAKRELLIVDPTVGEWLRQACAGLGCQLPLVQDVRQLRLLARDVQAHPSVPHALLISATVRNDAAFAQPYPMVTITLSDVNGKRLAMRRLHPPEYLGDSFTQQQGLPPGASTALVFEVEDPSDKAVDFEFGFE
ncbi:zinc-ribbon and DUF3426 domain-containing protein [Dyella tabacisoli]|uniref:DUF3426 domain-containing protein n=1 Tax=Dyella tabacisoli TaxID=2282381 RepID=A0A369UN89_9GAMM|nr:zinc-ribbon and DUF3426 domain-containing protein [Dyella tabacisoli]RDD82096.1 DUF3426 domain-containing protein [Dyella tabacisoli]